MFNEDTTGVTRKKPTPELFTMDYSAYQEPVDWVRKQLVPFGFRITEAVLDPYLRVWRFYEGPQFIMQLSHDAMERMLEILIWSERGTEKP